MKVSVVMSVYNGAATLAQTIDSVLAQTEPQFEFIIVDDGSTDATPEILAQYAARDARIRVLRHENRGLTKSLIRGCELARAPIIARQDCGDRSLPARLERQLTYAQSAHVLITCGTRFISPEGDELYVVTPDGERARESLLRDDISRLRGLSHHGSAMFRRDAYLAAGGYRKQFAVAQDVDLWIRLAAEGPIGVVPEVLYEAVIDPRGISSTSRAAQVRATALSIAMRDGADEAICLAEAESIRPARGGSAAGGFYFIARMLMTRRNPRWRRYMWRAAMAWLGR